MDIIRRNLKRLAIEVVGWLLVIVGLAALVLPGPGLLLLFAGLAMLSTQYDWAERRMIPIRKLAIKGATEAVESWWRISLATLGALVLLAIGIIWIIAPPAPNWWPVSENLWLLGGIGTGVTLIASAAIALSMLVYSWFTYRKR